MQNKVNWVKKKKIQACVKILCTKEAYLKTTISIKWKKCVLCLLSDAYCLISMCHLNLSGYCVLSFCSITWTHALQEKLPWDTSTCSHHPPPPPRLVFPKPISVLASIVFIASSACCYKVLSIYHCVWALVTQTTTLSFWGQVLMCCISAVSAWSPSLSSFTLSLLFSPVVAVYSVCRQDKRVIISYLAKGWRREESLY